LKLDKYFLNFSKVKIAYCTWHPGTSADLDQAAAAAATAETKEAAVN